MSRPVKNPRIPNPRVSEAVALIGSEYDRRKGAGTMPRHTALSAALALGVDPQTVYRAIRKRNQPKGD
jgi:deoxyribodipyrimidine photolyase